jgi:hypothetical protein
MADDGSGGPSVPNHGNFNEWTFEQALKALTSEGADLHAAAKGPWFNFNGSPGASDALSYHAWDKYYFGVNLNTDAINAWGTAVESMDEMMPDVAKGKRGSMDLPSLAALGVAISEFTQWTKDNGGNMDQWASRLSSDDSSFKGKAAFLIYWRLKVQGDGLQDTFEQLNSRHGGAVYVAVANASQQLGIFNSTMTRSWQNAMAARMRWWIEDQVVRVIDVIQGHLEKSGLYKDKPTYALDNWVKKYGRASTEEYIKNALKGSPYGDLAQQGTWQTINDEITQNALNNLKGYLDGNAQFAIGELAPKYALATASLIEITAPPPQTAPKPDTNPPDGDDGGGGGGNDKINLPPPPKGGGDDDANGGGNDKIKLPPTGGDDKNNPPANGGGGGGDLDLGNGGGGANDLDLGNGGGGPGGLDLGDGGGGPGGVNLADGGGGPGGLDPANGGGGGVIPPGLIPPGSGANGNGSTNGENGVGPGSDGAFDENDLGNDLGLPPADGGGGDGFSQLPSDTGQSDTVLPPGGANGGGSVDLSKPPDGVGGANSGLNLDSNGFGTDPGKGFGSGSNLLGLNGGAGNPLGGPGSPLGGLGGLNGTGPSGLGGQSLLSGGSPGTNGAPGSSGDGSGGVPFFPPMMGGGGGGAPGEKPQERERQTWLSEDEEIWGTRVGVRSGAIGRLDEEDDVEEFPLVGPSRGQRRADTPRRPRPDEKKKAEREATSGEEATGST